MSWEALFQTHTHMCIYRMSLPNGVEAMFLGKIKPLTIPALLANSCFLFNFKSLGETPPWRHGFCVTFFRHTPKIEPLFLPRNWNLIVNIYKKCRKFLCLFLEIIAPYNDNKIKPLRVTNICIVVKSNKKNLNNTKHQQKKNKTLLVKP